MSDRDTSLQEIKALAQDLRENYFDARRPLTKHDLERAKSCVDAIIYIIGENQK
jgi:hypothetical protein